MLFVLSAAGSARAVTAKWCFKWEGTYDDSSVDQDHLNAPAGSPNRSRATYTYVKIEKYMGYFIWSTLWQGYMTTNCSPLVEVLAGKTYRFTQRMTLQRTPVRQIEVHPDGEDWSGAIDQVVSTITMANSLFPKSSYDAPVPPDTTNSRLMPALTRMFEIADTLDIATTIDVDVSTDTALNCGSWCSSRGGGLYWVCIDDDWSQSKFNIAHELGHTVSKANDGPRWGDYWGSDGFYQATGVDNRCDCTLIDGYSHCPTSREFTGAGQKEGFSHFIAAASYNDRVDVDGEFVFYKDLMEWSSTHGGTLPAPSGVPFTEVPHPYAVDLSTADEVKWVQYECSPAAGFQPHMSNEWDWLAFFWNLWTDGGANKYSIDEINTVWHGIPTDQIAYDCCAATDTDPGAGEYWVASDCVHTTLSSCTSPGLYPVAFMIGKLWSADVARHGVTTGLTQRVEALYGVGTAKTNHFLNTGADAMVTYWSSPDFVDT
jgi:hypothetical protein